jgi:hypothetical protein
VKKWSTQVRTGREIGEDGSTLTENGITSKHPPLAFAHDKRDRIGSMSRSLEASNTDPTDLGYIIPLDLILFDEVLVLRVNEGQHQSRHKRMKWLERLERDIRVPWEAIDECRIGCMPISIIFAQFDFVW